MEEGEPKPGYKVVGLGVGWEFRTPAGRWERVVRVDHDANTYFSLVWTDQTGNGGGTGFGYFLPSGRDIHAIPPRRKTGVLVVRLVDVRTAGLPPRMTLILSTQTAQFAYADWEDLPCQAQYLGRGEGWEIVHRPDGVGELIKERWDDKLHAKRRMNAIAREFARGLRLEVGPEMNKD